MSQDFSPVLLSIAGNHRKTLENARPDRGPQRCHERGAVRQRDLRSGRIDTLNLPFDALLRSERWRLPARGRRPLSCWWRSLRPLRQGLGDEEVRRGSHCDRDEHLLECHGFNSIRVGDRLVGPR
jgi:hypothetical protein